MNKHNLIFTKISKQESGFTIVELMISIAVLSTILIISTLVIIQIGALYNKGVNSANIQSTNRNLINDVSQAVQFGSAQPDSCTLNADGNSCDSAAPNYTLAGGKSIEVRSFCIGTTRYSYIIGVMQGTDPSPGLTYTGVDIPHVLWKDSINPNSPCKPLNIAVQKVLADGSSSDATSGSASGGYDMVPDRVRLVKFLIEPVQGTSDGYSILSDMSYGYAYLYQPGNYITCLGDNGSHSDQYCATSQISSTVIGRTY